jgi:hypothetical protein
MRRARASNAGRVVVIVALTLLAVAAVRDFARLGDALPWRQLYDFSDFYCAGSALDARADPYRYESLRGCEHRVNTGEAYRRDPRRVVPAPLPPYDFPPFMAAARLNFNLARVLHAVAITVAVAACIFGLSLLSVPLDVAALALLLPAGFVLLSAGQVVPFALVALVYCGVALAKGRPVVAGVLGALTLIEPHLGLPVVAALLCCAPRARAALLLSGAALAVTAFAVAGAGGVTEYLAKVLPAQAAAETGYAYQYSLTYLLSAAGLAPNLALLAGEAWYAAMLVIGVWLGTRLARSIDAPELLVYLPAALSIFGGPYVHMVNVAFAIPAAVVLATRLRGPARDLALVAVALLAVPWIAAWIAKKLFLASVFVVAVLLVRLRAGLTLAIALPCMIALTLYVFGLAPPAPMVATTTRSFAPDELAQAAWADYVAALPKPDLGWLLIKLPTWLGLTGILAAALMTLRPNPRSAE